MDLTHIFGVETVTYMTIRFKLDDPLEPPVVRDTTS